MVLLWRQEVGSAELWILSKGQGASLLLPKHVSELRQSGTWLHIVSQDTGFLSVGPWGPGLRAPPAVWGGLVEGSQG